MVVEVDGKLLSGVGGARLMILVGPDDVGKS